MKWMTLIAVTAVVLTACSEAADQPLGLASGQAPAVEGASSSASPVEEALQPSQQPEETATHDAVGPTTEMNAARRVRVINGCRIALWTQCPGADLSGQRLIGAPLAYSDLSGANLSRSGMEMIYLREANLTGADLSHSNLRSADLEGANLTNANLECTNLTGIRATGAIWTGAEGVPSWTDGDWYRDCV